MDARADKMPETLAGEAAVLGSMMFDTKCIAEVAEILTVDSFFRIEHQIIFTAIIDLFHETGGKAIDGLLVREKLESRKQLNEIGGVEYLQRILDSVPSSANALYYAQLVQQRSIERGMYQSVHKLAEQVHSGALDVQEKKEAFEHAAMELELTSDSSKAVHIRDEVPNVLEDGLSRENAAEKMSGLKTGFWVLDDKLGGYSPGDFIVLAGRPSMGKSSIMLDMALEITRNGNSVAVFSMEMSRTSLVERLLSNVAKVSLYSFKRGRLDEQQWGKVYEAGSELSKLNIWIDDISMLTPGSLTTRVLNLKVKNDIKCVFVDYLQLMHMQGRNESRQQEITAICRQIKALAKKADIPIVVVSQLSRAVDSRPDHRPRLSDLRESGAIEQDADKVMLLYRSDYYRKIEKPNATEDGEALCIIAKNRQGPTGDVPLVWLPTWFSFANPAPSGSEDMFYD